ncbi:MAG TPA: hypothetical protein VE133_05840, partial [Candidatus Sulfotelmatobacter sp.]|nr:hypothetical protein [Candidatus Sulfotelmatobacter sp.]
MCGIVGFLSSGHLHRPSALTTYSDVVQTLTSAPARKAWDQVDDALSTLAGSFDGMMSFATFRDVVCERKAKDVFQALAASLRGALGAVSEEITQGGLSDLLRKLNESLRDYLWQVEVEVLGLEEKVQVILPDDKSKTNVSRLFMAWAVERVLGSLDKLEVRGRDSAGITIAVPVKGDWLPKREFDAELQRRAALDEAATGDAVLAAGHGQRVLRVTHKVANLVGRLGDNGATLRAAIRNDSLLWTAADVLDGLNIVAHTRWASNGLITISNCHPVSGQVMGAEGGRDVLSVINGDIDNYEQLMATAVRGRGLACNPTVTTDAKILPVKLALDTDSKAGATDRLMTSLRSCHGSLATAVQFLLEPRQLVIGQQGSGQALYVGTTADGWLFASEVYGLAAASRRYRSLNTGGESGVVVNLSVRDEELEFSGRRLTGEPW